MKNKLIEAALVDFGFLIARKSSMSFQEWADIIAEAYSVDSPKTKAVHDALKETPGMVSKNVVGICRLKY